MSKVTCGSCGARFNLGRDAQHRASRWHLVARAARAFRKRGIPYAEIARQLGLSRFYIQVRLKEEGL